MSEWWPLKKEYDPKITKKQWGELLRDEKIFNYNCMCMMKRFLHHNGEASCVELAKKYGRTYSAYISFSFWLASRIHDKTGCDMPPDRETSARYWPILYIGRSVGKNDIHDGTYVWKLRDELKEALEEIDLLNDYKYPLYEQKHDWETLLSEFKKLLINEKTRKVAFDDEKYKWELITNCKNKSVAEIIELSQNENVIDQRHTGLGLKHLIQNKKRDFTELVTELIEGRNDLGNALLKFKSNVRSLDSGQSLPNDERTASVYLTCYDPKEYTFYKDSYYSSLCDYFHIKTENAGNKYEHYMSLIEEFVPLIEADSEIMKFYNEKTMPYEKSVKLIAQNIIYVLFDKNYWFLTWNEDKWTWNNYVEWSVGTKNGKTYVEPWSCSSKQPAIGDHVFLMKTGTDPKGILAHGYVCKSSYESPHYDKERAANGDAIPHIDVEFDRIQNYNSEPIIKLDILKTSFPEQNWSPQSSGIQIKCNPVKLLKLWSDTIGEKSMSETKEKAKELAKLLKNTKNLILHGAPGTGKTYLAKNEIAPALAELLGLSKDDVEVVFVQFHPSYDYTDFVEGIRPRKKTDDDSSDFELVDGVFKKFCIRALKNIVDSEKSITTLQEEKTLEDKVNDFLDNAILTEKKFELVNKNEFMIIENLDDKIFVTANHIKVEKLSVSKKDIIEILRKNIQLNDVKDVRLIHAAQTRQQQDSYVYVLCNEIRKIDHVVVAKNVSEVKKKPFVFIIDEINRGELSKIFGELFYSIDSSYRVGMSKIKNGDDISTIQTQYANMVTEPNAFDEALGENESFGHFFVPDNVYIIGTMNDIDRSVESMDLAMRRRFTFKEIKANENLGMLDELDESIRERVRQTLLSLNNAISGIEGLSPAYHIGGAYFLKLKDLDNNFDLLWECNLEPLLQEYLRGQDDDGSKIRELKKAYYCSDAKTDTDDQE